MSLLTKQNIYLKDAVIDRIINIESKIKTIKDSLEYSGKDNRLLKTHVEKLIDERDSLNEVKQYLEQEIYNSSHNIT